MPRKRELPQKEAPEAGLQIESDSLAIITKEGVFRLPKEAVDQLVASLLISGFGPQTPADYNIVLAYRDMKKEASE